MSDPQFDTIRFERSGAVGSLTLNRPDRRNGVTERMLNELNVALTQVANDPTLLVLVLAGAGQDFCVGADLRHFTSDEREAKPRFVDAADFRATLLLHQMPAVTVAAITGGCAGAGFGWAAACDFRFASDSAQFATAFLNVGLAGDMAVPWLLPRIVGAGRARELCFLTDRFDAQEALRCGFVSRVFPEEEFDEGVRSIVERLARASPLALRGLKANFTEAERMSLESYIALESERHLRIAVSRDTREAFAAFMEKRAPDFRGY